MCGQVQFGSSSEGAFNPSLAEPGTMLTTALLNELPLEAAFPDLDFTNNINWDSIPPENWADFDAEMQELIENEQMNATNVSQLPIQQPSAPAQINNSAPFHQQIFDQNMVRLDGQSDPEPRGYPVFYQQVFDQNMVLQNEDITTHPYFPGRPYKQNMTIQPAPGEINNVPTSNQEAFNENVIIQSTRMGDLPTLNQPLFDQDMVFQSEEMASLPSLDQQAFDPTMALQLAGLNTVPTLDEQVFDRNFIPQPEEMTDAHVFDQQVFDQYMTFQSTPISNVSTLNQQVFEENMILQPAEMTNRPSANQQSFDQNTVLERTEELVHKLRVARGKMLGQEIVTEMALEDLRVANEEIKRLKAENLKKGSDLKIERGVSEALIEQAENLRVQRDHRFEIARETARQYELENLQLQKELDCWRAEDRMC
ncbi:hypothetical protein BDW59DRAFT_166345 [Aspergillus cavernicola]|uniref:BZIP domain-containing protein n=1 Tax=Aspergillus cavernicola TaxID=176166 RepID=A0ABR4HLP8_9EURO